MSEPDRAGWGGVTATMPVTLAGALAGRPNDHRVRTERFTARTGVGWHAVTPAAWSAARVVSVVVPACDCGYALPTVLDALAAQECHASFQVIVVDDASVDDTAAIAAVHPAVDVLVRLPQRVGPAMARNIGVRLAEAETLLFVDGDMVLPAHVVGDVAARAEPGLVLVGFRQDVQCHPQRFGRLTLPDAAPTHYADPRVCVPLPGGQEPGGEVPVAYVLDETADLQGLGFGAVVRGFDLPRMVEPRLLAAPRQTVMEVGGFDPAFRTPGLEGAHLGAGLIAAGLLVVPLRQAVAWHVLPPDPDTAWQAYVQGWPEAVRVFQQRAAAPPPSGRMQPFVEWADRVLAGAEVVRR